MAKYKSGINSGVSIELDGYDELIKKLNEIEAGLGKMTLHEMVYSAAEIVRDRAKQLCPIGDEKNARKRAKKGGKRLRDTISIRIRDYGKDKPVVAIVGPDWHGGQHGHLVEYGHDIAVGGAITKKQRAGWTPELVWHPQLKTMVFKSGAPRRHKPGTALAGKVTGRTRPRPFMRPAFDETKTQQMKAMEDVLRRALQMFGGE